MSRRLVLPRSNSHVGEFQSRNGYAMCQSVRTRCLLPGLQAEELTANRAVISEYHLEYTLATSTPTVLVCRAPRGEDRNNRFAHRFSSEDLVGLFFGGREFPADCSPT
ncbi:hypothetical protein PHSY_001203 [Pseudozyma hubeiensis SY62]|uniref:Uncharacterized protein n=1 Tax=Pseudozyma hubeiensis (strain SY62) TaxID=1305764 RepID=R9NY16_PSEHS|nr:hypothetical protein PHSY_001203 [Pseudozyma hubeiensis SY62]GAC93638.1 hypothetical protein PHSY_001203 [Pseudozyma hubeiensis SY62]